MPSCRYSHDWRAFLGPGALFVAAAFLILSDLHGWFAAPEHVARGQAALKADDYVQAIHEFSKAEQRCETDIVALYGLGAAYQNYGWHDEALQSYERVWALAGLNGTRAMHSAGRIWVQRGELARAAMCFQRAVALTPASPDIWFELGTIQRRLNAPAAAVESFHQAVVWAPDNAVYRQALQQMRPSPGATNQAP